MWHDPMDELIKELEECLPSREDYTAYDTLSMEDFCAMIALWETGTEEDIRHFEQHPSRRAYFERMDRASKERQAAKEAAKGAPQEP